ncbi:hypothetical protein D3C78_1586310 [compost metagenome]
MPGKTPDRVTPGPVMVQFTLRPPSASTEVILKWSTTSCSAVLAPTTNSPLARAEVVEASRAAFHVTVPTDVSL